MNELLSYIERLAAAIAPAVNNSTIDLDGIEKRENVINELNNLKEKLIDIGALVDKHIHNARVIQTKELSVMDAFLGKIRNKKTPEIANAHNDGSWTRVIRNKKKTTTPDADPEQKSAQLSPTLQPRSENVKIKFTEALALPATKVLTFDNVRKDGELYYVENCDHFAFYLGGRLFHGNIGMIYTEEKNPIKIKDCKFLNQCVKGCNCDYYHDPTKFIGSTDRRNFIASSWLYAPPNSQFKNRSRGRRFGSREYLDIDIVDLQEEEINRFRDQTIHDILCSLLLCQYFSD